MKNSLAKRLYHSFVCRWYHTKTFLGVDIGALVFN